MKILIVAGGSGRRFWPISRDKMPKQFIKIKNGFSTYQLALKRVQPVFGWNNIYVSTNEKYVPIIKEQEPQVPMSNIFVEPTRKDSGPAVGLSLIRFKKLNIKEPIAVLWADHFMENVKKFQDILSLGEKMIQKDECKIIFIGEKPRFANNNIGWISIGDEFKKDIFKFSKWEYRPEIERCNNLFKNKKALWNTGYFISTIEFLLYGYKKYQPKLYKDLLRIERVLDTQNEAKIINKIYPKLDSIHFDNCVPVNVSRKDVLVIKTNIGWEDPGTLYAIKNYFAPGENNYVKGNNFDFDSKDCLISNYEKDKLIATIKLEGHIIVNTKDVLLVVHKDHVREISSLLDLKEFKEGKFKKYV